MQEYERNMLGKYDINICSTRKIRGAVLCDTEQGLYILKEANATEERIQALALLYNYIDNQLWCGVDRIIENLEGNYWTTAENGERYILKKWFSGRECDVKKPGELLDASKTLAKLHLLLQCDMESPVIEKNRIGKEYEKHNQELKKVRSYVRKKTTKNEFETAFLKIYDEMYAWAEMAQRMLRESKYEELSEESRNKNCLIHGEYNYHNILMKENECQSTLCAVTGFEKFKQDIQVEDFYYFLRKVMEKYGWKERLGDNLLNAYSAVKPLNKKEIEYIKLRLAYPEKFWKIANAYYNTNKAWMPAKNVEKLNIAIRQTKEKERFLKNVFSFSY